MVITDDYTIFSDKYHNKQHLPDDLIKNIMDINTQKIGAQKRAALDKKNHKTKFNIVIRHIVDASLERDCCGSITDLFIQKDNITTTKFKGIFKAEGGGCYLYTKDLILVYESPDDCINNINGCNEWGLGLNTAYYLK
tara:strand:- start:44 stop:457 length:414 start_codon:yes stop_codon:yes gene_type:complete